MTSIDLTYYPSDRTDLHGAIIVCPGGGYSMHAEHEGDHIARWLNSFGVTAFVLKYSLEPNRHPAPLHDLQSAIRTVRVYAETYRLKPLLRVSCRPDAAILCYPVITFGEYTHPGSVAALLGDEPESEMIDYLSNHLHVTEATPPTFLWHTANDGPVPVENSLLYASALSAHKVPYELHIFPDGPHGLGLAPDHPVVSQWVKLAEVWLRGLEFA